MNFSSPSLLLIVEAAAPFFILSIFLTLALMSGRKKMKKAAQQLILNVKSSEKKDREEVKKYLKESLNIDKKKANKACKKITNEKRFLLRNILSGVLDKNVDAIANLNQDINRVLHQYHQLEMEAPVVEDTIAQEPVEDTQSENSDSKDENKALKKEIKGLKQEVHITLTTLNNIFKEFSSMFGENTPENNMSVEQIITAMESFSEKDTTNEALASSGDDNQSASANNSEDVIDDAPEETVEENKTQTKEAKSEQTKPEEASIAEQLDEMLGDEEVVDGLDFSEADETDDIDGALDMLELDSTDDEEPDWGDAFAESGDVMEEDKNV
ncbi:MAG: hypothetical protein ACPGJI_06995 [Kangiellaceae bacterium]